MKQSWTIVKFETKNCGETAVVKNIFQIQDVEFKQLNQEVCRADKVKIVACDAKSAYLQVREGVKKLCDLHQELTHQLHLVHVNEISVSSRLWKRTRIPTRRQFEKSMVRSTDLGNKKNLFFPSIAIR